MIFGLTKFENLRVRGFISTHIRDERDTQPLLEKLRGATHYVGGYDDEKKIDIEFTKEEMNIIKEAIEIEADRATLLRGRGQGNYPDCLWDLTRDLWKRSMKK